MRGIRSVLIVLLFLIIAVLAYNYGIGQGWTLQPPSTSGGINAAEVRDKGAAIAHEAAATAKTVVERTEEVVSEASLTAKIKSKMALDDAVKASTINVDTKGSVVVLTGAVRSEAERQRALRLARETAGVTEVIDKLHVDQ